LKTVIIRIIIQNQVEIFPVFIKLAKSNKVKKTIKLIVNDNFHIFLKIEMIL